MYPNWYTMMIEMNAMMKKADSRSLAAQSRHILEFYSGDDYELNLCYARSYALSVSIVLSLNDHSYL